MYGKTKSDRHWSPSSLTQIFHSCWCSHYCLISYSPFISRSFHLPHHLVKVA